ncbi:aminotransferase class V-fold PLP-dependent enzyme [Rhizobium sp. BK251]|uniref:pyridoxal-phosphate-dependent aminotransferase family protein n=1 Tax=Rhizobium sp. BK251 TaxID=2512125 RepID=UPI00104D826C|nr:aminotransferase class V-fold PLP-dependent enzyme [Rhizobium sp. BK251]TCL68110.1 aspartate aminotransferase-like enzyme [Rhizobium sp. BK251]
MTYGYWNPLRDVPAFPAARYATLADRLARIMHTRNDVLMVQAEAVVALEAVASSIARPGLVALNIVTSPYGSWFGEWLRRGRAVVHELEAAPGLPVSIAAVAATLEARPEIGVLSVVHAESASGILNPIEDILALARARNIVTVVDAVASIGGHPLAVDDLGVDLTIVGPQKGLGGPAGVSAVAVSPRGWRLVAEADGPANSILSLRDHRAWLDAGRGVLPGTPAPHEFFALDAALEQIESEGLDNVVARHTLAALATREGLAALGATLWVEANEASNLVTVVRAPDSLDMRELIEAVNSLGVGASRGFGAGTERLVRLNHTGARARFDCVLSNVVAYGQASKLLGLGLDIGAGADKVAAIYGGR